MIEIFNFEEGDYIYCTRIPGIHKILRVYKEGNGKPPTLQTELLYNSKYEKVLAKARDREYTIDATYCKSVDFKAMLNFELRKFEKVKSMVQSLSAYCE